MNSALWTHLVKDLRIEETPGVKENKPPPAVPNDPAIVGVS